MDIKWVAMECHANNDFNPHKLPVFSFSLCIFSFSLICLKNGFGILIKQVARNLQKVLLLHHWHFLARKFLSQRTSDKMEAFDSRENNKRFSDLIKAHCPPGFLCWKAEEHILFYVLDTSTRILLKLLFCPVIEADHCSYNFL